MQPLRNGAITGERRLARSWAASTSNGEVVRRHFEAVLYTSPYNAAAPRMMRPRPTFAQRRMASFLHDSSGPFSIRKVTDEINHERQDNYLGGSPKTAKLRADKRQELSKDKDHDGKSGSRGSGKAKLEQESVQRQRSTRQMWKVLGLFSACFALTFVSGDLLEVLVPGFIGVMLFVVGNIRTGAKWLARGIR